MTKTRFQTEWTEIAHRWSLTIETPFVVEFAGRQIVVPVLLRNFGAARGMLLVTDYHLIAAYADELVEQGYGFSCLSEPTDEASNREGNDDALMEMLADWGWSGEGLPPPWYCADTE